MNDLEDIPDYRHIPDQPRYYDREGRPLSFEKWGPLFDDLTYKRVASTWLPGKRKRVSTVWLGLDYCSGDGPPLIFESMVFTKDGPWIEPGLIFQERYKSFPDLAMQRYSTLAEARAGHAALVRWWRLNRQQRRKRDVVAGVESLVTAYGERKGR